MRFIGQAATWAADSCHLEHISWPNPFQPRHPRSQKPLCYRNPSPRQSPMATTTTRLRYSGPLEDLEASNFQQKNINLITQQSNGIIQHVSRVVLCTLYTSSSKFPTHHPQFCLHIILKISYTSSSKFNQNFLRSAYAAAMRTAQHPTRNVSLREGAYAKRTRRGPDDSPGGGCALPKNTITHVKHPRVSGPTH